ncbi:MAG: dihydrolipoamide acetyltransferase family protein [Bacillus sp. (in: firmicutes)]
MATTILMPKLGLTMTEGTVESWHKKEGDPVKKGEPICTISSEKLTHDVESPTEGTLLKIIVDEAGETPCQEPIGLIGEKSEKADAPALNNKMAKPDASPISSPANNTQKSGRLFITPIARKLAKERGLDFKVITGTGGNDRITRRDVLNYIPETRAFSSADTKPEVGEGLSGMRKVIAKRMRQSLQQTAQVTLHCRANISPLMTFREDMKKKVGDNLALGQLSINTLLVRAVTLPLKDYPEMNATYANGTLSVHEDIHIGIAVAVNDGLIVLVVKNASDKMLTQLAKDITNVVYAARSNTLSGHLLTGSTFTVSNLGHTGIEYFTPILNKPEIAILGVGAIDSKLAFNEHKEIIEKQELPLSLTFDHQVVDGAPAAEFLQQICHYFENPYLLLF